MQASVVGASRARRSSVAAVPGRQKFLEAANLPIIGATEAQLRSIKVPVCLIAGNDRIHPPAIARKVHGLIPQSGLHDDVVEKRPDHDLRQEWDPAE
jgi:pimeloyl-ACP methyl ester carboxylesterase